MNSTKLLQVLEELFDLAERARDQYEKVEEDDYSPNDMLALDTTLDRIRAKVEDLEGVSAVETVEW